MTGERIGKQKDGFDLAQMLAEERAGARVDEFRAGVVVMAPIAAAVSIPCWSKLRSKGERPVLEQTVVEGDAKLSV